MLLNVDNVGAERMPRGRLFQATGLDWIGLNYVRLFGELNTLDWIGAGPLIPREQFPIPNSATVTRDVIVVSLKVTHAITVGA